MYDRTVGGQELTFGVSGKLIANILVMYDHQTNSFWPQILGEALTGPMKGKQLEPVPSLQTAWAAWKEEHPNGQVLSKLRGNYGRGSYGSDVYDDYYTSSATGIVGVPRRSDALPQKERVVGLQLGGRAKAYAFTGLEKTPVLNDEFHGQPIVVAYNRSARTAAIFSRELEGQTLTFGPAPGGRETVSPLLDRETGSRWSGSTGKAVEGPLAGRQLTQLPTTLAFWFGWFSFFPDTEVYRG